MNINILDMETLALNEEERALVIIDQTKLPNRAEYLHLKTQGEIWTAIRDLQVRGAPAIGDAAAIGVYLAALEIGGDGDDTMCLHEGNVCDGEGGEDVLCRGLRSRSPVGRDRHVTLAAAKEGEFVDDGRDGLIHDGKGSCCARVCMCDSVHVAAVPIDGAVHHQFAGWTLSAARFDRMPCTVDDDDVVCLHLHAVHACRCDADIAAFCVANAEIARTVPAQSVVLCLLCAAEYRFFDRFQHGVLPLYVQSIF